MENYNANKTINGTFSTVWVNGEKWSEVKSLEAKITAQYEDIDQANAFGKQRKYMGFEGAGSMTLTKIYSRGAKLLANAFKTGNMPEIKIVTKLADPASYGAERMALKNVTFDEVTLTKFELKAITQEDLAFKFSDYETIDLID